MKHFVESKANSISNKTVSLVWRCFTISHPLLFSSLKRKKNYSKISKCTGAKGILFYHWTWFMLGILPETEKIWWIKGNYTSFAFLVFEVNLYSSLQPICHLRNFYNVALGLAHSCFISVVNGTELGQVYIVLVVKRFCNTNNILIFLNFLSCITFKSLCSNVQL